MRNPLVPSSSCCEICIDERERTKIYCMHHHLHLIDAVTLLWTVSNSFLSACVCGCGCEQQIVFVSFFVISIMKSGSTTICLCFDETIIFKESNFSRTLPTMDVNENFQSDNSVSLLCDEFLIEMHNVFELLCPTAVCG